MVMKSNDVHFRIRHVDHSVVFLFADEFVLSKISYKLFSVFFHHVVTHPYVVGQCYFKANSLQDVVESACVHFDIVAAVYALTDDTLFAPLVD